MKYMLMVYNAEDHWAKMGPEEQAKGRAAYLAFGEALKNANVMVTSNGLQPSATATTVRIRDGKTQVLNGPYADTKEQFGGFFLVDVPDLDAALGWAARCPAASHGIVEVRPVWGEK